MIINSNKLRIAMLLEPPKDLSTSTTHLIEVLQSNEIVRALAPFTINVVPSEAGSSFTDESGSLHLSVWINDDAELKGDSWSHIKVGKEEYWVQSGRLPRRHETDSWRHIGVKGKKGGLEVTFTFGKGAHLKKLDGLIGDCVGKDVTLGMVMDACILRYAGYRSTGR